MGDLKAVLRGKCILIKKCLFLNKFSKETGPYN